MASERTVQRLKKEIQTLKDELQTEKDYVKYITQEHKEVLRTLEILRDEVAKEKNKSEDMRKSFEKEISKNIERNRKTRELQDELSRQTSISMETADYLAVCLDELNRYRLVKENRPFPPNVTIAREKEWKA